MKFYSYIEPDEECGHKINIVSEKEIIETYWPSWLTRMEEVFGKGHPNITHEHCIDDFVMVHWANEYEKGPLNAE